MNLLFDITWKNASTLHLALETTVYNGKQYIGEVLSVTPLTFSGAYYGEFSPDSITIEVDDHSNKYRDLLYNFDTKNNYGSEIKVMKEDGTIIAEYIYESESLNDQKVTINAGNRLGQLNEDYINADMVIDEDKYPLAPRESLGKVIPWLTGQYFVKVTSSDYTDNSIKAYLIDNNNYRWVLGELGTNTITPASISAIKFAIASDGVTDVTANVSLIAPTVSDPYYYLQRASGTFTDNFLYVTYISTNRSVEDMIYDIGYRFFDEFPITISKDGRINFATDRWQLEPVASEQGGVKSPHFSITKLISGNQLLSNICKMLNCHWYIKNKEIWIQTFYWKFLFVDREFQDGESIRFIPNFSFNNNTGEITNQIVLETGYKPSTNQYLKTKLTENKESKYLNGFARTNTKFLKDEFYHYDNIGVYPNPIEPPIHIRKLIMIDNMLSQKVRSFSCDINLVDDLLPLSIIYFSHESLEDYGSIDDKHYFIIKNISYDYQNDMAFLDLIDVNYIKELDIEQIFLLQSNVGAASEYFVDESVSGFNHLFLNELARHDTSDFLYGTSCLNFKGKTGVPNFLKFGNSERYFDFDPWLENEYSVWIWAKFPSLGQQEIICGCHVDLDNLWNIRKDSNDRILFVLKETAIFEITVQADSDSAIIDNDWHLITFCRSNNIYSLYIDGSQEAYVIDSDTGNIAEGFLIGAQYDGLIYSAPAEIKIAAIGIWRNCRGPLSTAVNPNVSKTDTFSVPIGLWGAYYGHQYSN